MVFKHFLFRCTQILAVLVENLLPSNPQVLDGVDDLLQLSYLNEPSVLHNLECRYVHDMVYVSVVTN